MVPLATPADVQERLGRPLTESEQLRVESLLRDASAAVRGRSSQQFTPGESVVTLKVTKRGFVFLPQRPVVSVESVTDVDENTLGYTRIGERLTVSTFPINAWELHLPRGWPVEYVVVEYTHGSTTIPDDIIAVTANVAARGLGVPADQGGITQEGIDGYNYSVGSAAAQGGLGLLASELEVCDRYRRPATSALVTM